MYSALKPVTTVHKFRHVIFIQICISFGLHRGLVLIPKSVTSTRITENLESTEVKLDPEDMRRIREIDINNRLLTVREIIVCNNPT